MSFSRFTTLSTAYKGRNPLQQYYELTAPGTRDEILSQVQISHLDNRSGTYRVNYSVGGFSNNGDAVPLSADEIVKWVYASDREDFLVNPDALVNNPFINPRPDGSTFNIASTLEKMRKDWLLSLGSNPIFLSYLSLYTRDEEPWRTYETAVSLLGETIRIARQRVEDLGWNADGDAPTQLQELFEGMFSSLGNISSIQAREQARISIVKIAYGLLSDSNKTELALSFSGQSNGNPGSRKYNWIDSGFSIPYVLDHATSEYYSHRGESHGKFHINPEYHYYLDCYEEKISGSAIHETMLPNIYVHGLTLSGIPADPEFGPNARISSDWQGSLAKGVELQSAYDYHTTLGGRTLLPDLQMSHDSMPQYLQQIGNALAGGEIPPSAQRKIAGLTDSIIIPSAEYGIYNSISYNNFAFPMKMDIEIPIGHSGELGTLLDARNLTSVIARAIQYFEKQDIDLRPSYVSDYHLRSEYLRPVEVEQQSIRYHRRPELAPRSYKNPSKGMTTYNLATLFRKLAATDPDLSGLGEVDHSLLFSSFGREMAADPLSPDQEALIGQTLLEIQAFAELQLQQTSPVFNMGKPTYSEPLIYKLEKRDPSNNDIIQVLFFVNQKDLETVIYTDTQIKYNTPYDYQVVEYRLMTGVEETFTLDNFRIPNWVDQMPLNPALELALLPSLPLGNTLTDAQGDQARSQSLRQHSETPESFTYEFIVERKPFVQLVEHRIVGPSVTGGMMTKHLRANGVSFPDAKVMDRPPVPPDLLILPIKDNFTQVKTLVDPGSGKYLKEQSLPIVSIGNRSSEITALAKYQEEFEYYDLLENRLEFADEGVAEIKEFTLYWTTSLNRNISHYNDIYRSFNPDSNADARLKKFKTDELIDRDATYAPGFGALLNLEPNVTYYITCTVEDVHQNVSNPSPIYEARLHYEKGLLVPQIKLFHFVPINNKQISRKMARFIEIKASAIQTQPAIITNEDGEVTGTRRALAANIGNRVTNNDFVVRFTSRDTGKKFDLRLSFNQQDILPEPERFRCGPIGVSTPPVAVPQGVIDTLLGLTRQRTWNI
jgi:hypothetical protein